MAQLAPEEKVDPKLLEFLNELTESEDGFFTFYIATSFFEKEEICQKQHKYFRIAVKSNNQNHEDLVMIFYFLYGKPIYHYNKKFLMSMDNFFRITLPSMKAKLNNFVFVFETWDAIDHFIKILGKDVRKMIDNLHFHESHYRDQSKIPLKLKLKVKMELLVKDFAAHCVNLEKKLEFAIGNQNRALIIKDFEKNIPDYNSWTTDFIYRKHYLPRYQEHYDSVKMTLYALSNNKYYVSNIPILFKLVQKGKGDNVLSLFKLVTYGLCGKGPWTNFLTKGSYDPRLLAQIEVFLRYLY